MPIGAVWKASAINGYQTATIARMSLLVGGINGYLTTEIDSLPYLPNEATERGAY
jgi:hypothetical protein